MPERGSPAGGRFDLARVGAADKILAGAGAVLFLDSFLSWQRFLCGEPVLGIRTCLGANAWQGNGVFAGVLMGFLAFLLAGAVVASVAGATVPFAIRFSSIVQGLAWGTVIFGLIKFLVVLAHRPHLGAWLGLIVLLVIAYGAWMKYQESQVRPADTGFTEPPTTPPTDPG
jgi:hypothetical protein